MKKRELLYLHGLLMTVAREYVDRELIAAADLDEYHDLGVTPMSLSACRADHRVAVLELSAVLAEATDEATDATAAADGTEGEADRPTEGVTAK